MSTGVTINYYYNHVVIIKYFMDNLESLYYTKTYNFLVCVSEEAEINRNERGKLPCMGIPKTHIWLWGAARRITHAYVTRVFLTVIGLCWTIWRLCQCFMPFEDCFVYSFDKIIRNSNNIRNSINAIKSLCFSD